MSFNSFIKVLAAAKYERDKGIVACELMDHLHRTRPVVYHEVVDEFDEQRSWETGKLAEPEFCTYCHENKT